MIRLGSSFSKTCQYVCEDLKRAQVLDATGVRIHDHRLMAMDFECQQEMRPRLNKAVFHGILTFSPKENPDNALMVEIARKYLDKMGFGNTQYVIARHTDTHHPHLHLIANAVDKDGIFISGSEHFVKGIMIARQLTEEYKLMPCLEKDLTLTRRDRLYGSDVAKYEIYETIAEALPHCLTDEDLEKRLLQKEIETRYKLDEKTGKRLGISFKKGKYCFKGRDIDGAFTYQRLEKVLAQQQKLELERSLKQTLLPEPEQSPLHDEEPEIPRHRMRLHL
jgi:hypothetical protein